jgi:general secretion pathway protein K
MRGPKEGMALVLTLMVLAIVTAMVVEFAYGVYVNTSLLYNWQASQRLSLLGSSGASIAGRFVTENVSRTNYTYPGSVALPPQDPFKEGTFVSVIVEDENAKFNLNTLVQQNGKVNGEAHESLRRMLDALSLEEDIADLIADWMDSDTLPMPGGSERRTRDAHLDSIEEITLVKGIDRKVYDKLLPYITIYGGGALGDGPVNINSAEVPVLMSLSEEITSEMAQRIIDYREVNPFETPGNLTKVAGFESLGIKLSDKITVKSSAFRITVTASLEDGLGRTIECVIDNAGVVNYWKEF